MWTDEEMAAFRRMNGHGLLGESERRWLAMVDAQAEQIAKHAEDIAAYDKAHREDLQTILDLRRDLASAKARCERLEKALESIGRNVCGREPLAAAYARGVLNEALADETSDDRSEET